MRNQHILNISSVTVSELPGLLTPEIGPVAQLAYQYLADSSEGFLNMCSIVPRSKTATTSTRAMATSRWRFRAMIA